MHANLFDIRWSQFYAFIASAPDGSAKNRLRLRFGGFPKRSCRISELNSLGYSCLARSACHNGLEKLFTYSGRAYQTETWKWRVLYKCRSTKQDFPFCSSTSIKSTMTNEADFRLKPGCLWREPICRSACFVFVWRPNTRRGLCSTLTCGGEDHVDWISGQTRGLSGQ